MSKWKNKTPMVVSPYSIQIEVTNGTRTTNDKNIILSHQSF